MSLLAFTALVFTAASSLPVAPTLSAVRTTAPLHIDGALDEPDWARAPVASGFRQVDPVSDAPATLDSEVRMLFDDTSIYVGVFCRDPLGRNGVRVADLRKDFSHETSDLFAVGFDSAVS